MNPMAVVARLLAVYLQKVGGIWWKLPVVLIMFYQFNNRNVFFKKNLFNTYSQVKPKHKSDCKDPVVGRMSLGCYGNVKHFPYRYVIEDKKMSVDRCIKHCLDNNHPYAGHDGYSDCYCGELILPSARRSCFFKGWSTSLPGCSQGKVVEVYRTMFCPENSRNYRSLDGTCNDLNDPAMGSRLYRFGRNFPLNETYEDNELLNPNPRMISNKLLRRKEFIPVKQLNLLAAAWIQFMTHDWFDHGKNSYRTIKVPLPKNDPEYSRLHRCLRISRTGRDKCTRDAHEPMSFQNDVTHWWDGSQIYGSDTATNTKLREFNHGKLKVADNGWLPKDRSTNIDITGFSKNWWVGLSLLHNIFTREHNSICDMLRQIYPVWSDERLYSTARLINTAVMAKIHTVEWTPAILNNSALRSGMYLNWGLSPEKEVIDWLRRFNITIKLPTLLGSPKKLHGVPFSLTEEFVAVYRMHPLLPDHIQVKDIKSGKGVSPNINIFDYSFGNARRMIDRYRDGNIVYTFGTDHPGALTLHNYPQALMKLKLPKHQENGKTVDLGTMDIVRDRERGVPRYNKFRRLLHMKPAKSIDDITTNKEHVAAMKEVYGNDVEKVDLLIGCLAEEPRPDGFGFSDTQFALFVIMASRRIQADRFFMDDYNEKFYTKEGLEWVANANMSQVLLRAFPYVKQLPVLLNSVNNAFFPWERQSEDILE